MDYLNAAIILSRMQFALTLAFHILFPTLTIGLSGYLVIWEILWLKTRKKPYLRLCRFWVKIFALAFGMGVVSGIVLSYEFGTNFSKFSEATGNVLGPLMSYEVLTAFFLEAGFLGVMLFGWNRVSEKIHLFASIMVASGTLMSTFWILAANSWMHTPQGYTIKDGIFYADDWLKIIFNPSFPYRLAHMAAASYLTTTFVIVGISAWYIIKNQQVEVAKISLSLAMWIAIFIAPLQILLGDMHGLNTLKYEPMKIAAMEGRWETARGVPFTIFALPSMEDEKNNFAIEVPKLGSLILTHSLDGEIQGLKSVPKQDRPYVPLVFFCFRIMVGIGVWLLVLAIWGNVLRAKKKLFKPSLFHKAAAISAPLGFVAVVCGWFTTEVGRQPWVVYGLMRTKDAASILAPGEVFTTFILFAALYIGLLSIFLIYTLRLIKKGPEEIKATKAPDKLTSWLERKP